MNSPEVPPGSPLLDDEDVPVPCKGCNNVLEEGKAFELAGNRWHIDCFRCNSCGILLDSDANLLLLGDGSLICNNCTYSCTACGNKIEDLAILTGDQAFCAGCFRCRNCKRKIENLKYARTSQGIFCMTCHEILMARRKKRPKQNKFAAIASTMVSPTLALDKSLPSLPKEDDVQSSASRPIAVADLTTRPPRPGAHRTNSSKSNPAPDQLSPMAYQTGSDNKLRTPRSHKRHSQMSQTSQGSTEITKDPTDQEAYSFIPLVLDHSADSSPAPLLSTAYSRLEISRQNSNKSQYRERTSSRPPFERQPSNASSYHDAHDTEKERSKSNSETSDPSDEMQNGVGTGGGLAEQTTDVSGGKDGSEREPSTAIRKADDQAKSINDFRAEGFKLGEVPREKRKPTIGLKSPNGGRESQASSPADSIHTPTPQVPFNSNSAPPRQESFRPPPPSRTDSPASITSSPNRKALGSPIHSISSSRSQHSHDTSRGSNSSAITAAESPQIFSMPNKTSYASVSHHGSPVSGHRNQASPKPVLPRRPSSATEGSSWSPPPSGSVRPEFSPALPSPFKSPLGGLGFDEDLKRVFGGSEAVIRRVSNSIKHGRSLSEATRQSPKIPKSPPYAEITSPIPLDGSREDTVTLKQELRRSTQRIAELEAKLNNNESAKALETNIQEKRNTVALLETEREAFLRELMVIRERLDISKDGSSVNMDELQSDLIRGLAKELEDLKQTLKAEIQDLITQRDQLLEDVENYGRLREQAIQETGQLNMKNAQLADLNNELTRRIQGQFKANKHQLPGLGIYDGGAQELVDIREVDKRAAASSASTSLSTIGTPYHETVEAPEVMVAQKATTVKHGAQPKKFFWKKPGASIMKGAGKGFNRVFASDSQKEGYLMDGGIDPLEGSGKLFGTQKRGRRNHGIINGTPDGHIPIFGGELELRTAFEGARIPIIVQKCIQEVEMRGMDQEGIYRKSGGATQMRQLQEEFERGEDVQFSPDLDICSVTSVLKQYFRTLPNPLITYEAYDRFVESASVTDDDKRVRLLKVIVSDLPPSHKDVLQFTIFHLARVAARKDENLMNTRNLSVVFAPTLLRHLSDEREMTDMHAKNVALQFLIDFNEAIF